MFIIDITFVYITSDDVYNNTKTMIVEVHPVSD